MTSSTGQSPDEKAKGDCYSAGERAWMEYGQQLRESSLAPFLHWLIKMRVTADAVTILSMGCGLVAGGLWYFQYSWTAVALLWLHVVTDGLDGPLARIQNRASPRGSFTDSFCDQVVVTAVTISLMMTHHVSLLGGTIFLVAYTGVLAIAMVRNSLQVPYSWLIRPRFFVYVAMLLALLGLPQSVELVIWCSNILLTLKLASGFWKLRNRLDGPVEI